MLFGVSLGPGDKELLTVKAVRVLKEADEVIVPGELAYNIVRNYREARIVKFPMGDAERVVEDLSNELADRCVDEDIAFCTLGDVAFFSTFQDLAEKVKEKNPSVKIEMIPGVPSFTSIFSKIGMFVDKPLKIVTPDEEKEGFIVVLKAKESGKIAERLRERGFRVIEAEKIYMKGEYIGDVKEKSSYFTILVGFR